MRLPVRINDIYVYDKTITIPSKAGIILCKIICYQESIQEFIYPSDDCTDTNNEMYVYLLNLNP